ncbi:hypothetical protein ACFL28_04830 [Candidatus Omnitrophota bacterium]
MSIKVFKKTRFIVTMFLVVWILCPVPSYADGLRTGFGKVILENVPKGKEYSMRRDSKFPLIIENESDRTVELKIEVLVPEGEEIQEGYEAIPDADWITLEKEIFIIGPRAEAETDVMIHVPDDDDYLGRRFHVFIWSYTIGEAIGLGIKSKLLFNIGRPDEE